jgi:amino acid adenylation domain-containing protein
LEHASDSEPGLYTVFSKGAQIAAGHPALDFPQSQVSYCELQSMAENVAADIRSGLDGQPARVGLLASHCPEAYAGYLGIARTGAAVVPMNPGQPMARNAAVAREAGLDLLLTCEVNPAAVRDLTTAPVLDLTAGRWSRHGGRAGRTAGGAVPRRAGTAYLLFTSGSTGRPKGVPVTNRAAMAYLRRAIARYRFAPGDRLSHSFALTFDLSVFDLFCAWGSGATLVVPAADQARLPVRYVSERGLTSWFSVPSAISVADQMRTLKPGSMPALRWSLFCGEALSYRQAAAWRSAAPASVIENLYGPTELTVSCSAFRLPSRQADWPVTGTGTVPLGDPHDGLEFLVLDDDGRPAQEGELCARGEQRFDGYIDPADNAGRFVRTDGTAASVITPGSWYRTGDLVRRNTDGELVFLSRLDDQLKISGYRAEPGEIEAQLLRHPGIAQAVIVPYPGPATTELYAFYVGTETAEHALTAFLTELLPPYLVPRRYQRLDSLPRTANGKIDRKNLQAEANRATQHNSGKRPKTRHDPNTGALGFPPAGDDRDAQAAPLAVRLGNHLKFPANVVISCRAREDCDGLASTPFRCSTAVVSAVEHAWACRARSCR